MSDHTPGPWEVVDSQPRPLRVDGPSGRPIALIVDTPGADVDRANARLIAATPEMLAALRAFVEAADAWAREEAGAETFYGGTFDGAPETPYRLARDAIAKAEGR